MLDIGFEALYPSPANFANFLRVEPWQSVSMQTRNEFTRAFIGSEGNESISDVAFVPIGCFTDGQLIL